MEVDGRVADHDTSADADAQLARYVADVLGAAGGVQVRRLGALRCVFNTAASADSPVALVFRGEAYFKAGPDCVTRYLARGMRPFRPGPRQPLRGYWRVPPDVLAEAAELAAWAAWALDAARRFGKRRRTPRRKKRPPSGGGVRIVTRAPDVPQ